MFVLLLLLLRLCRISCLFCSGLAFRFVVIWWLVFTFWWLFSNRWFLLRIARRWSKN
jgi:hypothetical protein